MREECTTLDYDDDVEAYMCIVQLGIDSTRFSPLPSFCMIQAFKDPYET